MSVSSLPEPLAEDAVEHDEQSSDSVDSRHDNGNLAKKPIPSLKELIFVRLIDPIHIPSYLVEQIKDRMYSVDKFYSYQKVACIYQTQSGPHLNPTNFLYAIVNEKLRQVKGFLWMVLDLLTNSLVIQNFSMDKEYWNKGESIKLLEEKAKMVMKDLDVSRIVWICKNPKFCENRGFKKTKDTVMIYEG